MTTIASLRADLADRLGFTTLVQAESDRLDEALKAGLARATTDGIPGLSFTAITGELPGSLDVIVNTSGHTAGQSTITLTATPAHVFPGDFFKDASGNMYFIKSLSGAVIDTGSPIWTALADASTLTIYRRTLTLPTSAAVTKVVDTTNNTEIPYEPGGFLKYGLSTGQARGFVQVHDRGSGTSTIQFYPAPTNSTFFSIQLGHTFETPTHSTDIPYPYPVLDAIMERARQIWLSWRVGGISPTELEGARIGVTDSNDALNSSTSQPVARSGRQSRRR
tara:strand:- start:2164 stop:2997 length:834 start_codon:yes stop_codon:yes gene_type:complete